mmetsp:Transcript_100282/g.284050  ORF Transcript_100282/g.284050 Transcript_100282/m.284050 type:complete len:164 (+) Transcript_100282:164-655(+)|eukprot:CAMPEP_0179257660 /NCGR_PEP_ID=MMETSP0797-20121207/24904_1 /TAXON_ID=47934 /ORGANISM="Dinophysis acuminata, Strain DAEP01" /LENGTH=163 /DNA_ID=CAMNT_0020965647 /DNA_START=119 /DNA_END=610 /DNA_ORIENTATION=-
MLARTAAGPPVPYGTREAPNDASSNIKMFSDIHRYLVQRHAEVESLKALHERKNQLRKDAIVECGTALEQDAAERIAQVGRFSHDMEKHTNRKVAFLQKELKEQQSMLRCGDPRNAMDRHKLQFKIGKLEEEIRAMRSGLCSVSDAFGSMIANCLVEDEPDRD